MLTLREAGATILFLAPGFYHGADSVDDLVDFIAARALDQLGLEVEHARRWGADAE
jgi:4-hydroxy-3-polyprenylbenzoate decarboxylase